MKLKIIIIVIISTVLLQLSAADRIHQLGTLNGLSSNMVRCIYQDGKGYVWVGTINGLNRYDGFRFRTFFATNEKGSLPNSCVNEISEDHDGKLWIKTTVGYAIYDSDAEQFDSNVGEWMNRHGMKGVPNRMLPLPNGDYWIKVNGRGVYFYNHTTHKPHLFREGGQGNDIPKGDITGLAAYGSNILLVYNDGRIARVDGKSARVISKYRIPGASQRQQAYDLYVDNSNNVWVWNDDRQLFCHHAQPGKWLTITSGMMGLGEAMPRIMAMRQDKKGKYWIATDHNGLLEYDAKARKTNVLGEKNNDYTTNWDRSLTSVFVDKDNGVWTGTYKDGIGYISNAPLPITNYPIGDVCTIADDGKGHYWCGTNDKGIIVFDKKSHSTTSIDKSTSGLGSNTVVSSLCARDGSLWFGTYNGGLACYKSAQWTVYRKARGRLADDNVWALAELPSGKIAIGTLGAGVQILDPATGRFQTIDSKTSGLGSDYVSSLCLDKDGNLLIGHSYYFSKLNLKTLRVTNFGKKIESLDFATSPTTNSIICDNDNTVWASNESGVITMDKSGIRSFTNNSAYYKSMPCAMAVDHSDNVWIARSNSLERVGKDANGNGELISSFLGTADGLSPSAINMGAICCGDNGDIVVGTEDGISIVTYVKSRNINNDKLIFSGLRILGQDISVGQRLGDRVVLPEALDRLRAITLENNQNTFSILLSTDKITVPNRTHFLYRLKGKDKDWLTTADGEPVITFNNLPPGQYELQVRTITANGETGDKISTMSIFIRRPFYLSSWAFLVYAILLAAIAFAIYRWYRQNRLNFEARVREEKQKEIDEAKQKFFTNINHELRTPLTLIMSPLSSIIKHTDDGKLKDKLSLIERNARKMQMLVNQMLDFRSIATGAVAVHESNSDVVNIVDSLCRQFRELNQRGIDLQFSTDINSLVVRTDADKMEKIVTNLLSNAMKFAPDNGNVKVTLSHNNDNNTLSISVSDDGPGISDEEKRHIFERFYQADNQKANTTGSGIGLNIVYEYAHALGGTVEVGDSELGGARFNVTLPVHRAETVKPSGNSGTVDESKPTVMTVDDSDDFLAFMEDELSEGFNVVKAHNGREALDIVDNGTVVPDVIVTDVMMPEMDGNELCRQIKKNDKTRNIPVIMLSARVADEHKAESLASGADSYFTKPFNLDILKLQIANMAKWHHDNPSAPLSDKERAKIVPQVGQEEYSSLDEDLVKKATKIVEDNLDNEDLNVESFSQAMALSRVHLYRRLVSLTGKTPSEFIRYIRLSHAAQLLERTQLTVSEISYRVGYSTQRNFTRSFKTEYGLLPTEYRKRHADAENATDHDS